MSLGRAIEVLEAVAAAGRPVSVSEIRVMCKLTRPTAYRMIQTLERHQLVEQDDRSGYWVLGNRLKRIAAMGRTDSDIKRAIIPLLENAAADTSDTFFFSRLKGQSVEIIHVQTPSNSSISFVHPGFGRRPMHACSCSKVIAAFADKEIQENIVNGPLKAYTANTKTNSRSIAEEFKLIRKKGYAECVEELEMGCVSVAAPVHLTLSSTPFSVGAIGTVRRLTKARRASHGKMLVQLAGEIRDRFENDSMNIDSLT